MNFLELIIHESFSETEKISFEKDNSKSTIFHLQNFIQEIIL